MKTRLSVLLICFLGWSVAARGDDDIVIQFPKSDLRDLLEYYERLSRTPVYMALDLQAIVTVQTTKPISQAAALELIRKTLLEEHGIELRTTDKNETLAGWSKDPKYPRRTGESMTDEEASALPKGKIRIIKP